MFEINKRYLFPFGKFTGAKMLSRTTTTDKTNDYREEDKTNTTICFIYFYGES